jgi:hypothetical protein
VGAVGVEQLAKPLWHAGVHEPAAHTRSATFWLLHGRAQAPQ